MESTTYELELARAELEASDAVDRLQMLSALRDAQYQPPKTQLMERVLDPPKRIRDSAPGIEFLDLAGIQQFGGKLILDDALAKCAPGGTITLEFPHLMRLIEHTQFDTVYHEHFSYLSLFTVSRIFALESQRVPSAVACMQLKYY